jgi:tetratricopeptide (TPR) repeat protein
MTADSHKVRSIFLTAVENHPPERWSAFLDEACVADVELRRRVELLLEGHVAANSLLDAPAPRLGGTVDEPAAELVAEGPGTVIGSYKLLEQIGEGGFGVVFMAEQQEPIRRKVALKILKPGMDTRQVIARFEAERQALALMDHPNIARVLDAGSTPGGTGRPYFVMELVKGMPITEYCDQNQLTPRERLELFTHVCFAVQHAHQKGIIHRDLKPSNVLVTLQDGAALVKVIDFGIAKALGQQLTDKTLFTGFAQLIGTPLYMAPEQAALSNVDVDTRSDVYSLGVLLYELLTGTTPFTRERLQEADYDEMRRIIREEEPPKPSTRISTLGPAAATVSAHRKCDPRRLSQVIRGELDWIVMKALEKDRNRRYESASALAADVRRYLADEPVQACAPSAGYRLRKYARRHRVGLTVAGLILFSIALLAGGVGSVIRDRTARESRVVSQLEQALERGELLQKLGKHAEAMAAFDQVVLLGGEVRPDPARDARLAALKQRLDAEARGEEFLAQFENIRLRVQSCVKYAENRFTNDAAFPEIQEALRRYGVVIGETTPDQAAACVQFSPEPVRGALIAALDECLLWAPQGQPELRQWLLSALAAADNDAWRVQARMVIAHRDHTALEQLAREVDVATQPPSFLILVVAENPLLSKTTQMWLLRRTQRAYPADLWANHELAVVLYKNGRSAEAVRYFTAALARRPDNPGIYLNRGTALFEAGEVDAAIDDYRQAVAFAPQYAAAHNSLGRALYANGQFDEAIDRHREAIRIKSDYAQAHANLGNALRRTGRLDEAITACREAVRIDRDDANAHTILGIALCDSGRWDEAIAEHREAIRIKQDYAEAYTNLGIALRLKGLTDEAISAYREAIRLDSRLAVARCNLGNALDAKGRLDEAIAEYREAIRLKQDYAEAHCNLGKALTDKHQPDEAIAELREAVRLNDKLPVAHLNLGKALCDKDRWDEAIAEYREAIRIKQDYAEAHLSLGFALKRKGQVDDAIAAYRAAIRVKQDYAQAHANLGVALASKGRLDEAIVEYREAIRIQQERPEFHYNLGLALYAAGVVDEAIGEYREAIRLRKDYAEAYCNLGSALLQQGEIRAAVDAMRRGHELGSRRPGWPHPSARWLARCERFAELESRLPALLEGKATPSGPEGRIEVGELCALKRLNRAAVRFYEEAFTERPALADDLAARRRYTAACAAALAGCGQGHDAGQLSDEERARLRGRALEWLRADLEAWRRQLDSNPEKSESATRVTKALQNWLVAPGLAGVRGSDGLARLPEAEQQPWQTLWHVVADTLKRAQQRAPEKK